MHTRYHIQITRDGLAGALTPADLRVVVRANLLQDSLRNLLNHPEVHFDDSRFAEGMHYIEDQRRLAVHALVHERDRVAALQALGRLLHGRQDFYAHSNWVQLWVEAHGGLSNCTPSQIEVCLDPLSVPQLVSGSASALRYILYRTPLLGRLVKRYYLPPDSHEAMNLDGPEQGPFFPFAVAAATRHTRLDLEDLLQQARDAGGEAPAAALLDPAASNARST